MEVVPFFEDESFDPNIIFEGTGWLECAQQSCKTISRLFQEPLSRKLVDNVHDLVKTARIRWNSAYENNVEPKVVYPYALSLMRQMHPYADYRMQFPTFFLKDNAFLAGNIPGRPLGTDPTEDHSVAWFYHAAAVKILQTRLGAPLRCPVYEVMQGRRANCCRVEPSKGLCCSDVPDYIFFKERTKICPTFWGIVASLYRLLAAGGIKSRRRRLILDVFNTPPGCWPWERQGSNSNQI